MRVLLINNRHFHGGGADIVYFSTGKLLENAGHEVMYFSRHSEQAEPYQMDSYFAPDFEKGSVLYRTVIYFNNYEVAEALDKLLAIEHFDIAHAHLMWGGLSAAIIPVLHRHGVPLVHTAHDYRMICPAYLLKDGKGEFCERCKGGYFINCLKKRCSKGSMLQSVVMTAEMYYRNWKWHPAKFLDGIIFVSNFSRRKHVEFDERFAQANTMVLYNCPEENIKESLDLSLDTFNSYYLFYGRLSKEKGISSLIKAFEKYTQLKLMIVGSGPLEDELKKHCSDKRIDNISFLGYKSGKELFDLVARAKYVCVPSECYENNPMTIVEAYSLGTPVIGASIGGISEVIIDGETGLTFESGSFDSLMNTLGKANGFDHETYLQLKRNSFKFGTDNFSREKHLEHLLDFYKEIINCR